MAGLLSGLARFGLSALEGMDLYEKPKEQEKADTAQESKKPRWQRSRTFCSASPMNARFAASSLR